MVTRCGCRRGTTLRRVRNASPGKVGVLPPPQGVGGLDRKRDEPQGRQRDATSPRPVAQRKPLKRCKTARAERDRWCGNHWPMVTSPVPTGKAAGSGCARRCRRRGTPPEGETQERKTPCSTQGVGRSWNASLKGNQGHEGRVHGASNHSQGWCSVRQVVRAYLEDLPETGKVKQVGGRSQTSTPNTHRRTAAAAKAARATARLPPRP